MKIAIPVENGELAAHFGHCSAFAFIDVNKQKKTIESDETLAAPEHEPGLLPRWLAERGAGLIIAGGMGQRAKTLFSEHNIEVITGAPAGEPRTIVELYLADALETGDNQCDH